MTTLRKSDFKNEEMQTRNPQLRKKCCVKENMETELLNQICGNIYCKNSPTEKEIVERSLLKANMRKLSCENSVAEIMRLRKQVCIKMYCGNILRGTEVTKSRMQNRVDKFIKD